MTSNGMGSLQSIGKEADAAWQSVQKIWSLLNVEEKSGVSVYAPASVGYAGVGYDLTSNITQGVSALQRVGDSLKAKALRIKGIATVGAANSGMLIVVGHSKDGYPNLGDIFAFTGAAGASNNFPLAQYKPADKWSRSKHISLDTTTNVTQEFAFDVKFGHDVTYVPGTSTVASGSIWIAFISDVTSPNTPSVYFSADLIFVDN